jgi:voltage-gated potassium channel
MNNRSETADNEQNQLSIFQLFVLFLSVYTIVALAIQTFLKIPQHISKLLDAFDLFICIVFLADFFMRLYKAEKKWQFMKWGWIDLISSMPAINILRIGRVVRIVRVFRMLRAFRSAKLIIRYLYQNRGKSIFASVSAIGFLLILFSSISMLIFEDSQTSNIKTTGDALWWAIVTITTVGYGDRFPVTPEGRIAGAILMVAGVGLFGTFTAYIASIFIEPEQKKEEVEITELRSEIASLKRMVEEINDHLKATKG